ncbi:hypothetical protein CBR_g40556 [Chara braunii]|uniref:Reverse transcriptase RNase H-like domain-containing protein n=1 Tax=Chara braunii TaxID=69332 RepID=A0A388K236_CHABU|nr:hypothetical protein CBR_g40556 [Chara braunii]|eukprot:GBG64108.1 hypothetical protein CBR_g40556 [Chara braunii]
MKVEFKEGGLVLGAPNYEVTEEKPFIIGTDAGPTALGGVLVQADAEGKERPLRFKSQTLNTTERNYSKFKKETLAVLHCLRIFRNYVFGRRFILKVDPTALVNSLKNYNPSDPTVARWLTYIWMFNFELERIPADGLSRINWDGSDQESIEDTPPVYGFLDQEEDVRLHINEWSLRVSSFVSHPIWLAPKGYEQKEELVLKPFQEEDPWGNKDVGWMMKLALADAHSLVEEVRTIEENPTQVEEHDQLMRGMYLLTNTLLQGDFDRKNFFSLMENKDVIPESRDDEFEEGEIKEAFRAEEYDEIYLELGLLLSCEMRDRDASDVEARMQRLRPSPLGRDGLPIQLEEGNAEEFISAYEQYMRDQGTGQEEWMQTLPLWTRRAERPLARQIRDGAHDWEDCQAQLRRAFRRPEPERPEPRVERRQRSKRPRDPEARGAIATREGRKTLARREELVEPVQTDKPTQTEEPVQAAGPAQVAELPPTHGLEQVEFRRITSSDLQGPPPTRPKEREAVPLETPLNSLETHLDASQWRTSQLGADPGEPARYEPAEEPPKPEPEVGPRGPEEPRTEGVITVGDDTPPPTPIPQQVREYWPEGIPEPDSEEVSIPPSEATTPPQKQAEPEEREEGHIRLWCHSYLSMRPSTWTRRCQHPRGHRQREVMKPPIDPPTREQRIGEAWASYEGKRDAARVRSREAGQEDERVDEARETGDLGFSAARMAIERTDREIRQVATTSFQRFTMLSDELATSRMEVEQLSVQLAEERAENQAWRSRMEAKEAEWERRLQDMVAAVERLSATKVVDWTEQSRYGIQGEEVRGLFSQGGTAEPLQQEGMKKVFLDPAEAEARRKAEEESFSFKAPTELASQQANPMAIEIPAGESVQRPQSPLVGRGPAEESPMILLEVQGGTLTGAVASAEPKAMEEEASCLDELVAAMGLDMPSGGPQRHETPEHVPERGELRTQLGSWATEADSGGPTSEQQHEVMSEPVATVTPQPSEPHRERKATTMEGAREGRPQRLDTPTYRAEGGEMRAGPSTQTLEARPEESWSMPQSHEMSRETSEAPSSPGSRKKKRKYQRRSDDQCFFCKHGIHRALECPKFLKDKATGKVTKSGGKMYDRRGRVVERALDRDQEEAVERMKVEFKEGGLVLGAPNYEVTEEKPFIIGTDAGPTALGGVLVQADAEGKERPLRFKSQTLNTTERNYSKFKKETLAVLHCLRIFRNYVFGRRFILKVDPTALVNSLKNYNPSDPTVARWLTYIWMFNFELERIPADGLSRINWDGSDQESIEDTPPVYGFLDQEEDVRLHINEWSLRVSSFVSHPIWLAPKGYEQKEELVLKPFQEEDPWGNKDVGWMMKLALADAHSLVEEVRTIEENPTQVEEHDQLMRGMYLLTNTLLQGDFDRKNFFSLMENKDVIPESRDDEFEEGEIKEAFRAEEYDEIYLELGLLLSCEMRDRDASDVEARMQRLRPSPLGRDGLPIQLEEGNAEEFISAYEQYMRDQGTGQEEWMQTLPLWTRRAERPLARQIRDGAHDWEDCQAQLRRAFRRPEPERPEPRVERRQRSKRPRDPEARGAIATREGRKTLARREELVEPVQTDKPTQTEEPVQAAGPAQVAELPPTHGLEQVEFRRITSSDLQGPPPTRPKEREAVPLETPLNSLETHLDASQWRTSQLGADPGEPARYEPAEEPPKPEPEVGPRGPEEPRTEGVITVGDDTPPPTPIPQQVREYWPEGIPEPDSEEVSIPPSEATTPPQKQAEPEEREEGHIRLWCHSYLSMRPSTWTRRCQHPRGHRQREVMKPPIDPPTREQRIGEAWASYEGKRDAARVRSREAGQEDERVDEARETGDLGFSAARMAIERTDREIRQVATTSFQRFTMLSDELATSRMEVEQLSVQLAEERAENQAWRSRMEAKEAEWERRLQDMVAAVERLSATKVVDWTEQSRYGIQGEEVRGLFSQGGTAEPLQQEGMKKVFLDPAEAEARRKAEEESFSFKAPTELASQQANPMAIEIPAGESVQRPQSPLVGRGPAEESPMILLEVQGGTLTGAVASAEPKAMEEEASCLDELVAAMGLDMPSGGPQRHETPEHVPERGELRTQLGSWATEADSGGPTSEQQHEVMSEPVATVTPQPSEPHRERKATTMEGAREGRPQRLDTPTYRAEGGEMRAGPSTQTLEARPEESWSMPQSHEMSRETSEAPSSPGSRKKKRKYQRRSDDQCFFCKHGIHRALECPKFLKDKATGKVTKSGGKMYDRRGRVVERALDRGTAQLYSHN